MIDLAHFYAIPLMRGGNVSTPIENLVIEAQKLAKSGVKELILIAQDLTYYRFRFIQEKSIRRFIKGIGKSRRNRMDSFAFMHFLQVFQKMY